MPDANAQLQGVIFHTLLTGIRGELTPAQGKAVRGAGANARLENMRRLGFGPAEDFVELTRACHTALGPADDAAFWKRMGHHFAGGSLGTVIKGFQTAFGMSPSAAFRSMPTIWGMATRDAGTFTFEAGATPHTAALLFSGPAPMMQDFFLQGFADGFCAFLELAGVQGTVAVARRGDTVAAIEAKWGA